MCGNCEEVKPTGQVMAEQELPVPLGDMLFMDISRSNFNISLVMGRMLTLFRIIHPSYRSTGDGNLFLPLILPPGNIDGLWPMLIDTYNIAN